MIYPGRVYSVTICTDSIRDALSDLPYEINCNVCKHDFVHRLISRGWNVDQICIDHYSMENEYVAEHFGDHFFQT